MPKERLYQQPATIAKTETQEGQIVAMNEFGDGEIHGHRRTIKVARTVVGDQVRVRVPTSNKSYVYGELVKLLKPSEKRVDPGCAAFLQGCGGCQWLHFDYAQQLRWKTRILRDLLKQRTAANFQVAEILAMDPPESYRNKLSLRNLAGRLVNMQDFDDTAVLTELCRVETLPNQRARQVLVSLHPPREVIQIHVRSAEDGGLGINLMVTRINAAVRDFVRKIQAQIVGLVGIGAQIGDQFELLAGQDHIEYCDQDLVFRIPLNGFFQTNYVQARRLLEVAFGQLAANPHDAVLDLYCGCGFFTLPLARRARTVLGIETNAASTANASTNAALNGLVNVSFQTADVAEALQDFQPGEWPLVLLDPPRQGCDASVLRELARMAPRRIVYVSCSPSALARDLKILQAAGYLLHYCQPIDMFPHTAHMEIVVTLNRQ